MRLWNILLVLVVLGNWPLLAMAQQVYTDSNTSLPNQSKPFTGIVGISIKAQSSEPGRLVLTLQSDLPIQSETRFLDRQHLGIELENARLTQSLIAKDGIVHCRLDHVHGWVQSIHWKLLASSKLDTNQGTNHDTSQMLVLSGPNIGEKTVQIVWEDSMKASKNTSSALTKLAPLEDDHKAENYNLMLQEASITHSMSRTNSSTPKLMKQALALYKQQEYGQALRQVQQALTLSPKSSELYAALGETQFKLNNNDEALEAYKQAARLSPAQYAQRYAQLLLMNDKRQEALFFLAGLFQQNPKQPHIAYMLGTLYEEDGNLSQAITCLQQALNNEPSSCDTDYNLGLAYELNGDNVKAKKYYQLALALNASDADSTTAMKRLSGSKAH